MTSLGIILTYDRLLFNVSLGLHRYESIYTFDELPVKSLSNDSIPLAREGRRIFDVPGSFLLTV